MKNQYDLLLKYLEIADPEVTINLMNIKVNVIFNINPIYFLIYFPSEGEFNESIWLEVGENALQSLFGEQSAKLFHSMINEIDSEVQYYENAIIPNIDVEAIPKTFVLPTDDGPVTMKGFEAINIKFSQVVDDWRRGATVFSNDSNEQFIHLNDSIKSKIQKALLPYVDTPIMSYISEELANQFNGKEQTELHLIECTVCSNIEIFHMFEIANELCDLKFCRNCSETRYSSLIEVPFSEVRLLNAYIILNEMLEKFISRGEAPIKKIEKQLLKFSRLDHLIETGVTLDFLRNKIKKKFSTERQLLMDILNEVLEKAIENKDQFAEMLSQLDIMSSHQSLQTTKDTVFTYKDIQYDLNNKLRGFYFPHPLYKQVEDDLFLPKDIFMNKIGNIINLYKDTFDLVSDHLFIINLVMISAGGQFNAEYVSNDMFGQKLVNITTNYVRDTRLGEVVATTYDSKIRNAIAHPGRYIDQQKGMITIFSKGVEIEKIELEVFYSKVKKLIDLHSELSNLKYRLALKQDKEFLSTGGIISFQPEFYFDIATGEEKPTVVINQLYEFNDYSRDHNWWIQNLHIDIPKIEENVLRFYINRDKSLFFESPQKRESVYSASTFLIVWIEAVLQKREIVVMHRFCHYAMDIEDGDKDDPLFPVEVPNDELREGCEYFTKSINLFGVINLENSKLEELKVLKNAWTTEV